MGTQYYAPQAVYITKFDVDGNSGEQLDFALPKRAGKDATVLKVITGVNKLYVFSYIAVKKDKKNVLYAQVYDNVSGTVLETKEIYTLPIEKVNKSGFFNVEMSQDKNTLAVLINKPFVKKTKEKIETLILDTALNILSNNNYILSFDSNRANRETFFVENDGTITLIKKTDVFKKEPVTTAITIKGDQLTAQTISANKFYISDNKVITINNKQYLLGFATDNAKPTVSMGGAKDKSFFIYNLSDKKLIKNQGWNDAILKKVLGKGFLHLTVKYVIVKAESIYLVGDCFKEESKAIEGKNFEYNYSYSFGPGVVVELNTNGDVAFDSFLKYGEGYKNEMKRIGSFKPIIKNNDIYFLGNEKLSILEDKKVVFGNDNINAKVIVARRLGSNGYFSTIPFKSGIVGGKGTTVDFAPTQTIRLNEKTFYVYAFGNKYQAFGRMTME